MQWADLCDFLWETDLPAALVAGIRDQGIEARLRRRDIEQQEDARKDVQGQIGSAQPDGAVWFRTQERSGGRR